MVTEFGTYSSDVTISSLKEHDQDMCEDITIDAPDSTSVACQSVLSTVSIDICCDSAKEICAAIPEVRHVPHLQDCNSTSQTRLESLHSCRFYDPTVVGR